MTVIQSTPEVFVSKFTTGTAQTWTKQPWSKTIRVIIIGGGGPGGGGSAYASATSGSGGAGGGGGACIDQVYPASFFSGSGETYTVAAQVTGGAGTSSTPGTQAAVGNNSTLTITNYPTGAITLTARIGGRSGQSLHHKWCRTYARDNG